MQALDSLSTTAPGSPAKRPPRARRAEAPLATKTAEIQPLPRWAQPQGGDPGAAAFAVGAALALFDNILRAGPDLGEPPFTGCLRQRLALHAPEPGAPIAWATTPRFLETFALGSLKDLPDLDALERRDAGGALGLGDEQGAEDSALQETPKLKRTLSGAGSAASAIGTHARRAVTTTPARRCEFARRPPLRITLAEPLASGRPHGERKPRQRQSTP